MKAFNYLVEIILTVSLILVFLTNLQFPQSPSYYINSFNKKYTLYTALANTYNNKFLSFLETNQFDVLASIYNSMLSSYFNSYDLKQTIDYSLNFYNTYNSTCYEFLFPFPYLGNNLLYSLNISGQVNNFFLIYNSQGKICGNIASSDDWYGLIISSYSSNNLSIYLNLTNVTSFVNYTIDPYSFYAYDNDLYPIQIQYLNVSYVNTSNGYIPLINISLNLPNGYNQPIIILFRAENNNFNYLNLTKNYQLVNNLPAQLVQYAVFPFSWETLYISPQCLDQSNVISFTNNNQYFNLTNSSYYPPVLSGNTSITVVAWIYINSYYSSSCASGENYISAIVNLSGLNNYQGSTFSQVILPNNGQYYLGINESNTIGYLPNYPLPMDQWVFVFWEYNNSNGQFYGGFINQSGIYYGQLVPYPGYSSLQPLNLYYPPNETLYLGFPQCTFLGNIYVIAFYNQPLTINQLENIYYSEDFNYYNPVLIYYSKNYDPSTGILYGNGPNYNMQAYNNPQSINFVKPYSQLIIDYSIPPNYQNNILSSNINISQCYPVNVYYSNQLIPIILYNYWNYFNVNPVPSGYEYSSSIVYPYGLGYSKFSVYGS
ncbi:MAG: LamG domain-containing protein [Candidatus Nanopusillus sp.]|nr:LamG domain-containing protein [Candidatus Nanopusillus sp.]